jgi:hypothetical protein
MLTDLLLNLDVCYRQWTIVMGSFIANPPSRELFRRLYGSRRHPDTGCHSRGSYTLTFHALWPHETELTGMSLLQFASLLPCHTTPYVLWLQKTWKPTRRTFMKVHVINIITYWLISCSLSPSQRPRDLRHEMSSLARALGCGFESQSKQDCLCTFILCSVCRQRPCDGLIPVKALLPTV